MDKKEEGGKVKMDFGKQPNPIREGGKRNQNPCCIRNYSSYHAAHGKRENRAFPDIWTGSQKEGEGRGGRLEIIVLKEKNFLFLIIN